MEKEGKKKENLGGRHRGDIKQDRRQHPMDKISRSTSSLLGPKRQHTGRQDGEKGKKKYSHMEQASQKRIEIEKNKTRGGE